MRMPTLTLALALLLTPTAASADGLLTPFVGALFHPEGDSETAEPPARQTQPTFGASVGFMVNGVVGFEYDFSFTQNFFVQDAPIGDNNVMTSMFNVIVGYPMSGTPEYGPSIRPYGSGGIGLITANVDGPNKALNFRDNDLGVNVGGGVIVFLTDRFGARGDLRYFKNIQDPDPEDAFDVALDKFDFWRVTGGLVVRY